MTIFKHFTVNEDGRDFVVGDIHGNFTLLQSELDKYKFNTEKDRLFSTGDLVDRGPESEDVLNWLDYPWFHPVRGNHEQMAIDAADGFYDMFSYIANGGSWFINLDKEQQQWYKEEFLALPIAIEIETKDGLVGIVHAEVPTKHWKDLDKVDKQAIMWNRIRINNRDDAHIDGVIKLYVGHTPLKEPLLLGNTYYIDTGAFHTGKLTVMEI